MKTTPISRSSKVPRSLLSGFAIFMIFSLLCLSYLPGIAASSSKEARAAHNSGATNQDDGQFKPEATNGLVFTGGAITINDSATPPTVASPYPSNITVSGLTGQVGVVNVTLNGFSHAFPDDVDILLVGPTGVNAIILSDVGGSIGVSNLTINLDDNASASMADAGPLTTGTFKPTNVGAGDTFPAPAPAPSGNTTLGAFKDTNPNGTWSLYVVDDANGQAGSITSWSLNILTETRTCNAAAINLGTGGPALTYPSDITVSGLTANVSRVMVSIIGYSHAFATDTDMVLEGPTNNRAVNDRTALIWSDVGPNGAQASVNITLDDFAATNMPAGSALTSGTFKPTNADANLEIFPAPGPGTVPNGQVALSIFNGTNPNGTWHLWIKDDSAGDGGNISGGWCLTIFQGPTLARMTGGSATVADDGQVDLKWQTGYEVDNLGFNIYRDEGGQRVRVNKQLIAGSALVAGQGTALTAGRTYRWRDTSSKGSAPAQYWVEAVDINGSTILHGPINPVYTPGRSDIGAQSLTLSDLGRNNSASEASSASASSVSVQAAGSNQSAFKLAVKQDGYYRVTQSDLLAAGLSPTINSRNLQLFEDGIERPITVQGEQGSRFDSIEFYGTAPDNAYTDEHIYRLVVGSQPGLRIKTAKGKGGGASADSFLRTAQLKERSIYFSNLRNGEQENYFGAVVAREPVERALSLQNVARSAPSSAALEVALQGVSGGTHDVKVVFNGAEVGAVTFEGQTAGIARINVSQSSLKEGDNVIQLVARGGESDVSLINTLRIQYWHSYAADNDALEFTAVSGQQVTIGGFSNSAIRVIDLSNAEKGGVKEVAGTVNQDGNGYSVTINLAGEGGRTLLAVASNQIKKPASIAADIPSKWRKPGNKADLVIFTRADFISALEPLKAQRESQGLKVAVVNIDDVYDEFSYGNKTPQAIKDFLAYARNNWKVKPRFAMFAGDASMDPKNYLGTGYWDIVPTKFIDTQTMETASDEWFGDFNGDGVAEMALGRLPVRSAAEMSALVTKIVGYDNSAPSDSLLLVADSDDTFDFEKASAGLRAFIPGNLKAPEIARGTMDDQTARGQLLDYINQGQKVVNYIGHGNLDVWRGDLFKSDDADALANGGRLSLFVSMTCLNGYFQDTTVESISEALVKAPHGGAIAAWSSTGMCEPGEQGALNQEFYRQLFGGGQVTIGEAAMRAKSSIADKDIRRTWVLIGDPTTRLR